jgi:hypothetical protein
MAKKVWMFVEPKQKKVKPTELEKKEISEKCRLLVEEFKQRIDPNPDKRRNYITDIYTKWYQNYFYFCEKYKSDYPNRILDEFEEKFVRLTYRGKDCFDFSYFRHTGQWWPVATELSLQQCLEMMMDNPSFQPLF